jgi:hypothetical protein
MSFWDLFRGWFVDVIRRFWDRGQYRDVEWMKDVHKNWFPFWVKMKTYYTMKDVDKQIKDMFYESEVDPPVFSEEEEGETPLGGKMRLRAPWLDEEND